MQKIILLIFVSGVLCLGFSPPLAVADKVPPTNSCTQPHRPFKFKSDAEVNDYKAQVESYKKCINDFVEEQNQAIQNHRDAANRAIEEWNLFINTQSSW
ncbi:MAG: hypothetical protein ACLPN1_08420 [Dissulfurispiraceae bacterium]